MKDRIERFCETCNKVLKTAKQHNACFHNYHILRVRMFFTSPKEKCDILKKYGFNAPFFNLTEDDLK